MSRSVLGIIGVSCLVAVEFSWAAKPMRKLSYDAAAPAVELLDESARGKLSVRVIPQNEFRARVLIENLTEESLTVQLPKAVAAVHVVSQEEEPLPSRVRRRSDQDDKTEEASQDEETGTGQAVVGTFGPIKPASPFPHESEDGAAFTIPAGRSVQILLHSACAEHGKRSPISRMTYELEPLTKQVPNETLQEIIREYDPQAVDPLAFQAVVWHLANDLSWQNLAKKTTKRGGKTVPYFTRQQLAAAQKLIDDTHRAERDDQ